MGVLKIENKADLIMAFLIMERAICSSLRYIFQNKCFVKNNINDRIICNDRIITGSLYQKRSLYFSDLTTDCVKMFLLRVPMG